MSVFNSENFIVHFGEAKNPDFNDPRIGDMSDLTTTDKDTVVGAINEVNGKANENTENISLTNTRIDNIITSPAPTEQEIIDARLGANGTTYASLGDAIRGQITDLTNDVVMYPAFIADKFLQWNTGIMGDATGYVCSDFIPIDDDLISSDMKYVGKIASGNMGSLAFYSSANEADYISNFRAWDNIPVTVTIPTGAKYYRLSCLTSDKSYAYTVQKVKNATGLLYKKLNELTVANGSLWEE